MIKNIKLLSLVLIVFSFSTTVYSQQETEKVELKKILKTISKQHNIQFNYIEEEVSVFKLKPPVRYLSLAEKLKFLEGKTGLAFEIISNKYIAISSKKKTLIEFIETMDTIRLNLAKLK